ncbi:hypothetical protein [Neobacillus rhizophilus]|uniref:Uncharacterized protein n=1 Tax=Neobacillus rhizophilus TaxID=2833579 RepID=A0A942YVP9_9BACI|nr:hypothetical protein [Neobacillus rhizophilus]MBS4214167.1 hypothetical protein [Neobacillus rhizophilus]
MSLEDLKVLHNKRVIKLPEWIRFAFNLGAYFYEHGIKYKKPVNIIVSLPSDQYYSLFIAMGIADKTFSMRKQMRSIRKTILSLGQGSRIIYQDEQSSRKASVICVEPSPVFENEMILKIKDGKIERGIPEKQWMERIILLDEEFDEIKRTRKVSKNQKIGLDSPLLKKLYTTNQLNTTAFYPGDEFYLIGNVSQFEESIEEKIFTYNGITGSVSDFLYVDNRNSYTNGKFFSSQIKKIEAEINNEAPAIFTNVISYLKQVKYFSSNPKIIVSSRAENDFRFHEIKEEIKREMLQGDYKLVTSEIVGFFESISAPIPNGVEFLAWR